MTNIFGSKAVSIGCLLLTSFLAHHLGETISIPSYSIVVAQELTGDRAPTNSIQWRYTRLGWMNVVDWFRTSDQVETGALARVNPILLSVDIFLGVLAAMIWASDEREVARFLRQIE